MKELSSKVSDLFHSHIGICKPFLVSQTLRGKGGGGGGGGNYERIGKGKNWKRAIYFLECGN